MAPPKSVLILLAIWCMGEFSYFNFFSYLMATTSQFRMHAKKFFLTFPKCKTSREDAMACILAMKPRMAIVAQELHKDGDTHLHVFVEFEKKKDIRRPDAFDIVAGQHGNYQTARNRRHVIRYVTKSDPDYICFGITRDGIQHLLNHASLAQSLKELEDDPDWRKFAINHPALFVRNHIGLVRYSSVLRSKRHRDVVQPWVIRPYVLEHDMFPNYNEATTQHELYKWLLGVNSKVARPRRTPQLFIFGKTGLGKTLLIDRLRQHFRIYNMPHEHFYDEYDDDLYDLAVLDEFFGNKPLSFLNMWLEGMIFTVRVKGAQYVKRFRIPTIILSNMSPSECYHTLSHTRKPVVDAFIARLVVIHLTESLVRFLNLYLPILNKTPCPLHQLQELNVDAPEAPSSSPEPDVQLIRVSETSSK